MWPLGASLAVVVGAAAAARSAQLLPTGQRLTPLASPGARFSTLNPHLADAPRYVVGQTISEALSPDRHTLLVLTSGYNRRKDEKGKLIAEDSQEYVFVFDVSGGAARQRQVLKVPDTYVGIAFAPDGAHFVVSGGGDDELHIYERGAGVRDADERSADTRSADTRGADTRGADTRDAGPWRESAGSPVKLGHAAGIGIRQKPLAQGVAVSPDGKLAVVANRYNASVSVVDLESRRVSREIDLRPGKADTRLAGTPGGEYPNSVSFSAARTVFVSSEREREVDEVDLERGAVRARLHVSGNPGKMIVNRDRSRLFVALDNADAVALIDTQSARVIEEVPTVAPPGLLHLAKRYRGASPNALALDPDERTLYVTDRGTNALAVVDLAGAHAQVIGLIPTGWYPSDVAVGPHDMLYVVNTQSVPGPNLGNCLGYETVPCPVKNSRVHFAPNQYILNLAKGGLLSLPVPHGATLAALTRRVAANDQFEAADGAAAVMQAVREHIKHVIYIIKENRTYDQVLGDVRAGNGDASLAEFPRDTTPNQHALAERFVLLDAFHDSGNVSGNGWPWSTSGRESDAGAKMLPVDYAQRGGSYDWEGTNSNVNVALQGDARVAANPLSADPATHRFDPDELPGAGDIAAPDGPEGEAQQGYLWNSALRAGLTVRNYGFMIDLGRYRLALRDSPDGATAYLPLEREPAAKGLTVAYASNPELTPLTDPFFRGFDPALPDFWREREWEREFREYVAHGNLPALSLVRFMNDHTGDYAAAIDGINTPERQVADNDLAVGLLIEAVARSPYARDTLIFIVEDDAQDGPDHVDAHRSIAFIAGPCVRQGRRVATHLTTVNLLRTMTDVLGIDHLGLFDATQRPMSEVFDARCPSWDYRATVSGLLRAPDVTLPIPPAAAVVGRVRAPTHPMSYWAKQTAGLDFTAEDRIDAGDYNRILWRGLMRRPYPSR
jgi:YVTN family beta-propeller protein